MENKREVLLIQLNKLCHLFMMAKESFLYTEYFHNPETKEEKDIMNDTVFYYHFRFLNHILFRNTIIEFAKIFSDRKTDKLRLTKFISYFKSDGHYSDLGFPVQILLVLEAELVNFKVEIDTMLKLRDELYAHTDTREFDYNSVDINFNRIAELLQLAQNFIGDIYSKIFETHMIFDSPKFERNKFPILKVLALGEIKRKKDIVSRAINSISSFKR